MKSARMVGGVAGTIVALLLGSNALQSADNPAQTKPTVKGEVVPYEDGKSITIEAATSAGKRRMEFTIVKDKTEIKLLGDARVLKIGMTAAIWAEKSNIGKAMAAKIEAGQTAGNQGGVGNNSLPKSNK